MADANELYVVTAFFTDDGAPAYLTADGSWTRSLQEAAPLPADERDLWIADKAARDQRTVCDPYGFKVAVQQGAIDPLSTRERIRSQGPTTRLRRAD